MLEDLTNDNDLDSEIDHFNYHTVRLIIKYYGKGFGFTGIGERLSIDPKLIKDWYTKGSKNEDDFMYTSFYNAMNGERAKNSLFDYLKSKY